MAQPESSMGAQGPAEGVGRPPAILQVLPRLDAGGVERTTVDIAGGIAAAGWTSVVASAGGALVHELQRLGVHHEAFSLASKNPVVMLRNARRLQRLIESEQIDIVHAHSRAPAWSALIAARRAGVPFVTTFHGLYGHANLAKQLYNRVMASGDRVIVISSAVARHVIEIYRAPRERLVLIHDGIDLERFDPERISAERVIQLSQEWRLPDGIPILLLPARLTRLKGHGVLLDALAQLKDLEFLCVMAGAGTGRAAYQRELEDLVERQGLEDRVRIVEHIDDMAAAYKLADVVVSPSTRPEGFGRTIAEAQAMGRPVVATAHGGALDQIRDRETGALVQPGAPAALAEGLRWALTLSPEHRAAVHAAAYERARRLFGRRAMIERTLDLYYELLTGETVIEDPLPEAVIGRR